MLSLPTPSTSALLLAGCALVACGDSAEQALPCGNQCAPGADAGPNADGSADGDGSDDADPAGDAGATPHDAATSEGQDGAAEPDAGTAQGDGEDGYFGAARCANAGLALCDDFEAEAVGAAPDPGTWAVETWGSGSAVIDDSHAARGSRSVHIHTPAATAKVFLTQRQTFPAAENHFFGRMFLYVERIPEPFVWNDQANYPLVHWTAAAATGTFMTGGSSYYPEVRAIGGINQKLLINVDGGGKGEQGRDDMPPAGHESIAEQEWMCFEFEYGGEGAGAELRVWWDGVEHEQLHLLNAPELEGGLWPIPRYETLSFGWAIYQDYGAIMPEGFDVWIDAVAVDSERIGCTR